MNGEDKITRGEVQWVDMAMEDSSQPPRRPPPRFSIALWLPAIVGLTVALLLGAFTSLGMAAPVFPALTGRAVEKADIIPAETERAITTRLAALARHVPPLPGNLNALPNKVILF